MKIRKVIWSISIIFAIGIIMLEIGIMANRKPTEILAKNDEQALAESAIIEFNEGVGENLTAKLNTESGELTISGTGPMNSYILYHSPWYSYIKQIKKVTINEGVTSIGNWAFNEGSSITSVTIPESVINIETWAFGSCSALTEIKLPKKLASIGDYAFCSCTSLTSIEIPEGVTSIGEGTFHKCTSLTSVKLPEKLTSIGDNAFENCSSLTNINIPEKVTNIGAGAFSGCENLVSMNLPENITKIEANTFYDCTSLTSVKISDKVVQIGKYAFSGCKSLTEIKLPEGITNIGNSAFYNCESLVKINLPNSIINIGESAFRYCKSLTNIELPEKMVSIGVATFFECNALTQVKLPEGITNIGSYAFKNCTAIKEITIPYGVTNIGGQAFYGCTNLTTIKIPREVTNIGEDAFKYGFDNLINVTIYCRKDSYAKTYASDNNLKYVEVEPEITNVAGNTTEKTHTKTLTITAKDELYGLADEPYSFDGGTTWQKENSKTYNKNTKGIIIKVRTKDGEIATYKTIDITNIIEGHSYPAEFTIDKQATCEEKGKKSKKCIVEGCTEKIEEEIPALGHDWKKATCTEAKKCTRCNKTEGEALGHNYQNGVCTRCGEKETIFVSTSTYKITNDKYITGVKLETDVKEFLKNIKEEYTVKLAKKGKDLTAETEIVGTETKVTVSKNGEEVGEYTIVVVGDLTGDGKMSDGDLLKLARCKVGLDTLSETMKMAADVTRTGKEATDGDLLKLARILVGLEKL